MKKISADFLFLDSGTGGIPYLNYLKKKIPSAKCVYIADSKNFPYGTKSKNQIEKCAINLLQFALKNFKIKAVVVACNTISVTALDALRKKFFELPIVGTVPAVKLGTQITQNKKIGLLATKTTIQSEYLCDLIKKFGAGFEFFLREDGKLISFIEQFSFSVPKDECENACKSSVEFFRQKNCDVIILGCTHFLNIADSIQKVAGKNIRVVDSRDGVVRRAISLVPLENNENKSCENPKTIFLVTGNNNHNEYEKLCKKNNFEFLSPTKLGSKEM